MARINVSRVINSPKFSAAFTVYRKSGQWVNGRFEQTESTLAFCGTVVPAGSKDILQVPEGDRSQEIMVFLSTAELFVTRNDPGKGTSDEIGWKGKRYRVQKVKDWDKCGYYRAIAVSMEGD